MTDYTPVSIVNHETSGMLSVAWADGSESRLSHGLLRSRCKCAACQQQFRQQSSYPEVLESIRLTAIHPVSDKGLNLVFSDGHSRGIFPWAYLFELSFETTS
jgi:DUF971 family protein